MDHILLIPAFGGEGRFGVLGCASLTPTYELSHRRGQLEWLWQICCGRGCIRFAWTIPLDVYNARGGRWLIHDELLQCKLDKFLICIK